jgi:hypothetical protein
VKRILDLLGSLVRAWPLLVSILGGLAAILLWVARVGQSEVTVAIPLSLVVGISALAIYPFAKAIQSIFQSIGRHPFPYAGLLWTRPFLSFRYPQPICPKEGCGHEVVHRIVPPPSIQVTSTAAGIRNLKTQFTYEYECPIHGKLAAAPDLPIEELQLKARIVERKL